MIKIIILGEPVSALRPAVNTETKAVYTKPKYREYLEKVENTARNFYKDKPIKDEPLKVVITIYRKIPKSFSKTKREQAINGVLLPITKPDMDNYVKSVIDGCTGVVWKDDNIIVNIEAVKYYSKVPRAEIRVFRQNNNLEWE